MGGFVANTTFKTVNLIYITTTYYAQTFDLYVHMFHKVVLNMKEGGGKQQQSFFRTFQWHVMFILNFFSEEPIHRNI